MGYGRDRIVDEADIERPLERTRESIKQAATEGSNGRFTTV